MEQKITRREALGAAGAVGAVLIAGRAGGAAAVQRLVSAAPAAAATAAAAGSVAVTPSMTEGPYWIDEMLRRFDVRASTGSSGAAQPGVPLDLKINVLDAANGGAIEGAHVDIWHANAYGLYSDEPGQQTGGGTTSGNTSGQNFLRGYQVTGVDPGTGSAPVAGRVSFKTIWPGWYSGRAVHIHVRVRTYDTAGGVATNYTTQIFFSDTDNATVMNGAAPYNSRSPKTDPTIDESDNILTGAAHATNIVPVTGSVADGFVATFTIGLSGVASNASSGSSPDTAVSASLVSAKVAKADGARTVVVRLRASEWLTAHASVTRGAKTLGKATGQLAAGTYPVRVSLPANVAAGTATVKVVLADTAGNRKTVAAKVTIPA